MPLASKRSALTSSGVSRILPRRALAIDSEISSCGFSLVEGLVAGVVVLVAVLGTAVAFNLVTSFINRTAGLNAVNAAIDRDVALVKGLASDYTSCVEPTGSVPSAGDCDVGKNFSAYYFPMDAAPEEQQKFFDACLEDTESAHITAGFVEAIDDLPAPGSGVTRNPAYREDGTDHKNHTVVVEYVAGGSVVRLLKVYPVVSSWCG